MEMGRTDVGPQSGLHAEDGHLLLHIDQQGALVQIVPFCIERAQMDNNDECHISGLILNHCMVASASDTVQVRTFKPQPASPGSYLFRLDLVIGFHTSGGS